MICWLCHRAELGIRGISDFFIPLQGSLTQLAACDCCPLNRHSRGAGRVCYHDLLASQLTVAWPHLGPLSLGIMSLIHQVCHFSMGVSVTRDHKRERDFREATCGFQLMKLTQKFIFSLGACWSAVYGSMHLNYK